MPFTVVLDAQSLIGQSLQGKADATYQGHPALDCLSVEQQPAFLGLVRRPAAAGRQSQRLCVRYMDVVLVAEYGDDEPRPFGFGAASP